MRSVLYHVNQQGPECPTIWRGHVVRTDEEPYQLFRVCEAYVPQNRERTAHVDSELVA